MKNEKIMHRNNLECIAMMLCAFLALSAKDALAQVPSSASPGQIDQRFRQPLPEPEQAAPSTVVAPAPPSASPELLAQSFTLRAINLEGVTVYPEATFYSIIKPKLNREITVAQAFELARAITSRYRADGYVLTQAIIPPQNLNAQALEQGELHIKVVEGFIDNVIIEKVSDDKFDRRNLIGAYADKIRAMRPLNTETLERYMLLINDLPGMRARAVIRPSQATFGAADVVIQVENKPYEASFTTDNRGNEFLGPYQQQLTLTENSVAGLGERTTVRAINTIQFSELHYFDIQHEAQIGTEGTRLIAFASDLNTKPGGDLKLFNFKGKSRDYALTLSHPFLRSRAENFTGRFMFDVRDTENSVSGIRLNHDRVRTLRMGGNYTTGDKYNGVNLFDALISQGVDWIGATRDGVGRSRSDGEHQYAKLNVYLSRLQNLPDGFSVLTTATAQAASDPLLLSEQFSLGGVGFGQAYDSGEISGDNGLAGKIELRYGQPVGEKWFDSYQLYTAYDIGAVTFNGISPVNDNTLSLSSLSAGVRANFTNNLYGYLEAALPLTRNVASEGNNDARVFFSLTARY